MPKALRAMVIVGLLAVAGTAAAMSVGPRVGFTVPQLRAGGDNAISSGYASRFAPYFGAAADVDVSSRLSLEPEINYSPQGGQRSGMQPVTSDVPGLPAGMIVYANYKSEARLNYLEIPVLLKLHFGPARHLYADLGPHIGYLLSAKDVTSGNSPIYSDPQGTQQLIGSQDFSSSTDTKGDLRHFNWGVQGGFGAVRAMGAGELSLDVRGNLGLTHIQKDTVDDGDNRTGAFILSLGYMIPLGGDRDH